MLVKITETDPKYISQFRDFLMSSGATATAEPTILCVPDNFNCDDFHGVSQVHSTKPFHVENADVVEWLKQYTGNFHFYISLKSQLAFKGHLSPKQVASVRKAITRTTVQPTSARQTTNFSLKPGDIINVSRWLAREVGQKAGLTRPHYTLEVTSVECETDRAYKATFILSGQRMSRCAICGLTLTDPRSVTAGIGPIMR
jgi:hypothetical protein